MAALVDDHHRSMEAGRISRLTLPGTDQQIGQLYELMQAIQKQELGEEDIEQPEDIIEIDKKP